MRKITISQVKEALSKKELKEGLEKYLRLRDGLNKQKMKDSKFQKSYKGFFRMRRDENFCTEYFKFMEKCENNKKVTFKKVLDHLYDKTKKVEASFASKLLSMINPDMPVLDSQVLKVLCIKLVRCSADKTKRIECSNTVYREICEWYKKHFDSGEAEKWIKLFDKHYPEAKDKITDVKKIDLILWQIRE